jgi:hypothetical protein
MAETADPRQFRQIVPILLARDVDAALAHYRLLGFETEGYPGGGYGFVSREGAQFHVAEAHDLNPATSQIAAYLYVGDAAALHEAWTASGAAGRFHAPTPTEYGLLEGAHVDGDGNLIRYGSFVDCADEG